VRCPRRGRAPRIFRRTAPRARGSRSPPGNNSTSSPGPTLPENQRARHHGTKSFHRKRAIDWQPEVSGRIFGARACRRIAQRFFSIRRVQRRFFALTGTIGAFSRNDPRRKLLRLHAHQLQRVAIHHIAFRERHKLRASRPANGKMSKCSRVCGLMDSSAAITSSNTSMPAAPAKHVADKTARAPGTSTRPKRTPFSSRKAKPRSMVMPRRFSSASLSGCVPVRASTQRRNLPWSMCPAVPTITLFVRCGHN